MGKKPQDLNSYGILQQSLINTNTVKHTEQNQNADMKEIEDFEKIITYAFSNILRTHTPLSLYKQDEIKISK